MTAHFSLQYQRASGPFAWVIPVEAKPEVGPAPTYGWIDSTEYDGTSCAGLSYANDVCPSGCGVTERVEPGPGGCRSDCECGTKAICVQGICIVAIPDLTDVLGGAPEVVPADTADALTAWAQAHRLAVPSAAAIAPYLGTGRWFVVEPVSPLASELWGAVAPIEVRYRSDTAPRLPVRAASALVPSRLSLRVLLVDDGRGITTDFAHLVLYDPLLSHLGFPTELLAAAVAEAPDGHGFATRWAVKTPPPAVLYTIPFNADKLAASPDATAFATELERELPPSPLLASVVARFLPLPASLSRDVTPAAFYRSLGQWLRIQDQSHPPLAVDAAALARAIGEEVVPALAHDYELSQRATWNTVLWSELASGDLTADPAFGRNPALPELAGAPTVMKRRTCEETFRTTVSNAAETEPDLVLPADAEKAAQAVRSIPATLRIERQRQSGPSEVTEDHTEAIRAAIAQAAGCGLARRRAASGGTFDAGLLVAVAALLLARRAPRARVTCRRSGE